METTWNDKSIVQVVEASRQVTRMGYHPMNGDVLIAVQFGTFEKSKKSTNSDSKDLDPTRV